MANVILSEITVQLNKYGSYSNAVLPSHLVLTDGATYTVTYNGANYVCEAFFDDQITPGVCLGNMDTYMGGDNDEGEPFMILSADLGMTAFYDLNGNTAVTLSIIEGEIEPDIEPEYPKLPAGYKLLEYIASTGTNYIDTGVYLNQNSRIVTKLQLTVKEANQGMYGARTQVGTDDFSARVITSRWQAIYGTKYGSVNEADFPDLYPYDTECHVFDHSKTFYLDGVRITGFGTLTFTTPNTCTIGGANASNGFKYAKCRFYYFQIYDGDTLIRDMIPCKNADGEVGMYDLVNGVFYGNAGTGELIAGPVVAPLYDELSFQIGLIMGLLSGNVDTSVTPSDTFDANSFDKGYRAGLGLRGVIPVEPDEPDEPTPDEPTGNVIATIPLRDVMEGWLFNGSAVLDEANWLEPGRDYRVTFKNGGETVIRETKTAYISEFIGDGTIVLGNDRVVEAVAEEAAWGVWQRYEDGGEGEGGGLRNRIEAATLEIPVDTCIVEAIN